MTTGTSDTTDSGSFSDLPICRTCGVQYAGPRPDCPICEDERQYVGWDGQQWTTLSELRQTGHRGLVAEEGPGVLGVGTEPKIAVGQRALLVKTEVGNILWDCIPYLDDDLAAQIDAHGGITAIAVSHPHFYGAMTEWGHAFGAPVYIHAADRAWVGRPDPIIRLWEGVTREIAPGVTLLNLGVHFEGATVMHWRDGEAGRGALFTGDTIMVAMDRRWTTFMYSFPNYIPERPRLIRRAVEILQPYEFERIYAGFWGRVVGADASAAVRRSAERYLRFALDNG
jgi:glyoxylase-like metal-dependent hydrolase (beta-lactamase superfamily II)